MKEQPVFRSWVHRHPVNISVCRRQIECIIRDGFMADVPIGQGEPIVAISMIIDRLVTPLRLLAGRESSLRKTGPPPRC